MPKNVQSTTNNYEKRPTITQIVPKLLHRFLPRCANFGIQSGLVKRRTKGWQEGLRVGVWEQWGRVMAPYKADAMSHPLPVLGCLPCKTCPKSRGGHHQPVKYGWDVRQLYMEEISQRDFEDVGRAAGLEGVVVGGGGGGGRLHCVGGGGTPLLLHSSTSSSFQTSKWGHQLFEGPYSHHAALLYSWNPSIYS